VRIVFKLLDEAHQQVNLPTS